MHCVEILRELAAGGRSIITTIHQPSSRLYQSLDKLLLLSQVLFRLHTAHLWCCLQSASIGPAWDPSPAQSSAGAGRGPCIPMVHTLVKSCSACEVTDVCFVQGHALYYGRAQLADDYFEKMGYPLPYRVNVADFILDLASGDVSIEGRCSSFGPSPCLVESGIRSGALERAAVLSP